MVYRAISALFPKIQTEIKGDLLDLTRIERPVNNKDDERNSIRARMEDLEGTRDTTTYGMEINIDLPVRQIDSSEKV